MSRKDIEAGRAFVRLGVRNDLKRELAGAFKGGLGMVTTFAKGVATAAAAGAAGLAAIVKTTADANAQFHKLGIQTGTSAEQMSRLKFAAGQTGVEFDDVVGAVEELNIRLGETIKDGTGPAGAALEALGLSAKELAELPVSERIGRIGDELRKISDNTRRGFLADEIFGGDAFKVLSLLEQGSDGIARLNEESDKLGATISNDSAAAAAEFNNALNDLQTALGGVLTDVGEAIIDSGALTDVIDELVDVVAEVDWKSLAEAGVDAFGSIGDAMLGLLDLIPSIVEAFQETQLALMELQIQAFGGRDTSAPTTITGMAKQGAIDALVPGAFMNRSFRQMGQMSRGMQDAGAGDSTGILGFLDRLGGNLDDAAGSLAGSKEATAAGHAAFNKRMEQLRQRLAKIFGGGEGEEEFYTRSRNRDAARQDRESLKDEDQTGNPFFGRPAATETGRVHGPKPMEFKTESGGFQSSGFATASAAAAQAMGFGGKSTESLLTDNVEATNRVVRVLEMINTGLVHE